MNIYLFTKYLADYGGAERIAFRFANYLHEQNIYVKVFCGKNKLKSDTPFDIQEIGLGKSRYGKAKVFYDRASTIAESLDGVVFSFERMKNANVFRPGGGVHKTFMKNSLKGLTSFQKLKKQIKRAIDPVNRLNPKIESAAMTSESLKFVLSNSHKLSDELIEQYPDVKDKIVVIHNGVKKDIFDFERRKILRKRDDNDIIIGFAASNFQLKGLAQLISSLSMLPDNFKLRVAGGRNPEKYINLAKSLRVNDRISFLGKVSEMDKFYSNIDIFCLPTFFDNFANVVSEAVAMGTPAATSKFAGSNEIIENGVNGYVFDEITPENIAKSIKICSEIPIRDFSSYLKSDSEVFDEYLKLCKEAAK